MNCSECDIIICSECKKTVSSSEIYHQGFEKHECPLKKYQRERLFTSLVLICSFIVILCLVFCYRV